MGNVSHKLSNSLEGALAGGGDPATSPLYVFGPFLKLIVVAGVAQITFGASVWMVIFTIAMVSAMYRLVMRWVTDGSGGSGLSEEEFGPWAVKLNAGITFIEYTLTFLVSVAALVTFVADRFPAAQRQLLVLAIPHGIGDRAQYFDRLAGQLAALRCQQRLFGPATGRRSCCCCGPWFLPRFGSTACSCRTSTSRRFPPPIFEINLWRFRTNLGRDDGH